MNIKVPDRAAAIIKRLESEGYEAYVVGGCVRDSILKKKPNDWDITTGAKPSVVKSLFSVTIDTGIKHGTVTVMMGRVGFEVTTFRVDGDYSDGRHPDSVCFTASLTEDLRRRDFTINAMAYSDSTGLVDEFGGISDLKAHVIRCVGDPVERFGEDALRMLRAVRFAGQLGFEIEEETFDAIKKLAPTIKKVSAERIAKELEKLLISKRPEDISLCHKSGLFAVIMPELDEFFSEKAGEASKLLCAIGKSKAADDKTLMRLRWSLLLLPLGSEQAGKIIKGLKYDNDTLAIVKKLTELLCNPVEIDEYEVRRTVNAAGHDLMPVLFEARRGLSENGCNVSLACETFQPDSLDKVEAMYKKVFDDGDATSIKELALTGNDLMAAGVPRGKEIGRVLSALLERVLKDPELNEKEKLLELVGKV